jgi:hypothetical protein
MGVTHQAYKPNYPQASKRFPEITLLLQLLKKMALLLLGGDQVMAEIAPVLRISLLV